MVKENLNIPGNRTGEKDVGEISECEVLKLQ